MNAPFLARILRSYQERAATYLYERDAAFLIAPLGAGKGAAAKRDRVLGKMSAQEAFKRHLEQL